MPTVNRRGFLMMAGLPPAAAALAESATPANSLREEIRRYRKIDAHNHIFNTVAPREVIAAADRLEIERIAISSPLRMPQAESATPKASREANNFVLQAMKDYPGRFLGQCFVNPYYGREALEEAERCIDSGMIGLGELYTQVRISDARYFPIIEKCIELKVPLLMHGHGERAGERASSVPSASIADDFVEIGRRYPDAMIIYGHIGGGGDWEYVCKTLRDAPTIYADTSGSITDEGMVDFAVRYLGVHRLLFATDLSFETGVGKVLAARLTDAERRMIFFENFNGILRKRGNHVH